MTCNFKWCATFSGVVTKKNSFHTKKIQFPTHMHRPKREWEFCVQWQPQKNWQTKGKVQSIMEMDSFCDKILPQTNHPIHILTHTEREKERVRETHCRTRRLNAKIVCKWNFIWKQMLPMCWRQRHNLKSCDKTIPNAFWTTQSVITAMNYTHSHAHIERKILKQNGAIDRELGEVFFNLDDQKSFEKKNRNAIYFQFEYFHSSYLSISLVFIVSFHFFIFLSLSLGCYLKHAIPAVWNTNNMKT